MEAEIRDGAPARTIDGPSAEVHAPEIDTTRVGGRPRKNGRDRKDALRCPPPYTGVIARTTSMRWGLGQIRLSQGRDRDSVLSGG